MEAILAEGCNTFGDVYGGYSNTTCEATLSDGGDAFGESDGGEVITIMEAVGWNCTHTCKVFKAVK
jgi:hypothetical protein